MLGFCKNKCTVNLCLKVCDLSWTCLLSDTIMNLRHDQCYISKASSVWVWRYWCDVFCHIVHVLLVVGSFPQSSWLLLWSYSNTTRCVINMNCIVMSTSISFVNRVIFPQVGSIHTVLLLSYSTKVLNIHMWAPTPSTFFVHCLLCHTTHIGLKRRHFNCETNISRLHLVQTTDTNYSGFSVGISAQWPHFLSH